MALIKGVGITKRFGGVNALTDVEFKVEPGAIVGLIGPNGAGKTTLFNIVAGVFGPTQGKILFRDHEITGLPSFKVCSRGIARTFQVPRPFMDMTCLENVGVGVVNRNKGCPRSQWTEMAARSLAEVGLEGFEQIEAKHLNVVQKKKLEIARAMVTRPKLLMLDEVLGGLNSQEIQESIGFIRDLRDKKGVTIFWIEHVMGAIMQATENVIVLDQGRVLMDGPPERVVNDERVIKAYLGE